MKILENYSDDLLIFRYQLTRFQAPSSNAFRDILLTRFHSDFSTRTRKKYGQAIFPLGIHV